MVEELRTKPILGSKVTPFGEAWFRASCHEFQTAGMGETIEEAQALLEEATIAAVTFIVHRSGETTFPGDENRLPLAQQVLAELAAGKRISDLFCASPKL